MCTYFICVYAGVFLVLCLRPIFPSCELLKTEAAAYSHRGLSVEDAEASKLHMPKHPSGHEVAAGQSLELHVLLGIFPLVTLGLGGTHRRKERPLKVASGEALHTSWIIPPRLPLTLHHNCLQNESKPSFFELQALQHLI